MLTSLYLLVGLLFAAGPPAAFCDRAACSCITSAATGQSPTEFVRTRSNRAERVVLGTVLRLDTLSRVTWGSGHDEVTLRPVVARVRVRTVWRGPATDTMTVMLTGLERRSSCDLTLHPGKSYVIFGLRTNGGPLATRQCSGTEEEHAAAATIAALGSGVSPNSRNPPNRPESDHLLIRN